MAFQVWNKILSNKSLRNVSRKCVSTSIICHHLQRNFKSYRRPILRHVDGVRNYRNERPNEKTFSSPFRYDPSVNDGFSLSYANQRDAKEFQRKIEKMVRQGHEQFHQSRPNGRKYVLTSLTRQADTNDVVEELRDTQFKFHSREALQPTKLQPFREYKRSQLAEREGPRKFVLTPRMLKNLNDTSKRSFSTYSRKVIGNQKRHLASKSHNSRDYWQHCECCPEKLECDETKIDCAYVFPCPPKFANQEPAPCPLPKEPEPPKDVPLRRLGPRLAVQKQRECIPELCEDPVPILPRKPLPCLKKNDCPCVEPFVPPFLPCLKPIKNKVYQEIDEEACKGRCHELTYLDECKCLPPLEPKPCPCIEPKYEDPPPLRRLCLDPVQKIKECKPQICPPLDEPVLVVKKLPCFRNDCVCIEPPPLRMIKLKRLPKICVCPEPPDEKCILKDCEVRADDVCKYEAVPKKLKDWWCPKDRVPQPKQTFCPIHTRGQKPQKICKKKIQKRCMSTFSRTMPSLDMSPNLVNIVTPKRNSLLGTCSLLSSTDALSGTNNARSFRTSAVVENKKRDDCKKKLRKVECPKFVDECCPAPEYCLWKWKGCTKKHAPYPSFSECGEFSESLTCECKLVQPYLQPNNAPVRVADFIVNPAPPSFHMIDPMLEEKCVRNELCRPAGVTKTCENFHVEHVPIRQRECFMPGRVPCHKMEQICDFNKMKDSTTCEGKTKEAYHYRCECICGAHKEECFTPTKFAGCGPKHKAQDKKGSGKRSYSTFAGHFNASRQSLALSSQTKRFYSKDRKHGSTIGIGKFGSTGKCVKPEAKADFAGKCDKNKGKMNVSCVQEIVKARLELEKKACPGCVPKYDFNECPRYKKEAECCVIPIPGEQLKGKIPRHCLMPKGPCPCPDRVRFECVRPMDPPCCIIECPYPAFSDCHPPFKRLKYNEKQVQHRNYDDSQRKLRNMMYFIKEDYSTSANPAALMKLVNDDQNETIMEKVLSFFKSADEVKCTVPSTTFDRSKRNVLTSLPKLMDENDISNIPANLFKNSEGDARMTIKEYERQQNTNMFKVLTKMFNDKCGNLMAALDLGRFFKDDLKAKKFYSTNGSNSDSNNKFKPKNQPDQDQQNKEQKNSGTILMANAEKRSNTRDVLDRLAEEARWLDEFESCKRRKSINELLSKDYNGLCRDEKASFADRIKHVSKRCNSSISLQECFPVGARPLEIHIDQFKYDLMTLVMPLRDRVYMPYALSHEEYLKSEIKTTQLLALHLQQFLTKKKRK